MSEDNHKHTGNCCPSTNEGILQSQAGNLVNLARFWHEKNQAAPVNPARDALLEAAGKLLILAGGYDCEAGIWLYSISGDAAMKAHDVKLANEHFKQALSVAGVVNGDESPSYGICLGNLGECKLEAGDKEGARRDLEAARAIFARESVIGGQYTMDFVDQIRGEIDRLIASI